MDRPMTDKTKKEREMLRKSFLYGLEFGSVNAFGESSSDGDFRVEEYESLGDAWRALYAYDLHPGSYISLCRLECEGGCPVEELKYRAMPSEY